MPQGIDGWLLKVEGKPIEDGHFQTREEALRVAHTMCDTLKADVMVHHPDGSVTRH
jgi:hypothetical protein